MNYRLTARFKPYLIALLIALGVVLLLTAGNYYLLEERTSHQKHSDPKKEVYLSFINKMEQSNDPMIRELLNIGSLTNNVNTDGEAQNLEGKVRHLLTLHDTSDIYWRLNSDFNTARLGASDRIKVRADDVLNTLTGNFHKVQITNYSPEVQAFYRKWWERRDSGIGDANEKRITPEERFSIIMSSKLLQNMIQAMKEEIGHAPA